jgi:hypothetical protein
VSAPPRESLVDLGRELAREASGLVHAEIGYARARATDLVMALRGLIVTAVIAALVALLTLIFALATLAVVLTNWLFPAHPWLSWLIITALLMLVAAGCAVMILRRLRRIMRTATGSMGELKEDLAWVRQLIRRNTSAS